MTDRHTQIKGDQIIDAFAGSGLIKGTDENLLVSVDGSTIAVSTDTLGVPNDGITETQLNSSVAGSGLTGGGGSVLDVNVDDFSIEITADTLGVKAGGITNNMLSGSIADDKLLQDYIQTSEVDDSTIEFSGGDLNVKDGGITEPKLDVQNAAASGSFLSYDGSQFKWSDLALDFVEESDVNSDDFTASCDGSTTVFDLSTTPIDSSVQVFLNGLYQQKGGSNDWDISGSQSVEFSIAPRSGDLLVVHYMESD